ncbi:hypothetical protein B5F40_08180 [Gordonibacter sp. An230]|uniref:FAD-binding protein n=1 Tax=Gordonibacter sp. An230 TaxID=1965592 RepID=UPI000B3829FC|nr:FAD-binding protein [Gordonibacter sp. An230]OUO90196.1 hypothetical protein B5F40_08180 [Gordonibacter sp. An230]
MGNQINGVSRRQFLMGAGLAAGAVGLTGLAGCAPSSSKSETTTSDAADWDTSYDVVVVGFGDAGAAAAITAADNGARVLLIDKAPEHEEGGNSRYCEQVMLTWENEEDGYQFLKAMADGHRDATEEILRYMAKGGKENKAWLESLGATVSTPAKTFDTKEEAIEMFGPVVFADASSTNWLAQDDSGKWEYNEYAIWPNGERNNQRICHSMQVNAPDNNEKKLWKLLRKQVENRLDSITVWFNAPATKLVRDSATGVVTGLVVKHNGKNVSVLARNGIVLSCGSYEANLNMLETYAHRVGSYPVGSIHNTGDGITMTTEIGAQLWHMSALSGPYIESKVPNIDRVYWGCTSSIRWGSNGNNIYVDIFGKRFMAESGYQHHGHLAIGNTPQNIQLPKDMWAVMDATGVVRSTDYGITDESVYLSADTISELAEKIGVDAAALEQTVSDYNSYCDAGHDMEFNRAPETLAPIETPPFYAAKVFGGFVNAQGGAKRDVNCQILDARDNPIPHLYGAGEFGSFWAGAYIAGGNIAECLYSGRTAGANAAASKDDGPEISVETADIPSDMVAVDDPTANVTCGENEYAGAAEGIHEYVVVKVKVESGKMTNIEVVEQHETSTVTRDLWDTMPQAMIEANSTDVDTVTGATTASNALKNAVQQALDKANGK